MSEKTVNLKIVVAGGLQIGRQHIAKGKTVTVPKSRAEMLLKKQRAVEIDADAKIDFADPYAPPTQEQIDARKEANRTKLLEPDASATDSKPDPKSKAAAKE